MRPVTLSGMYKRGSTWRIAMVRKASDGTPVNLTGLVTRIMFRADSVDGAVIVTLSDGNGLAVDPTAGRIDLTLTATQSALFAAGSRVYFDIEQTEPVSGHVWQSPTCRFTVEQEVTR